MILKLRKEPSVYIITSDTLPKLYKIGFSANIQNRLKSYNTSIPGNVKVEHIQYFRDLIGMKLAEKLLHYSLASYRQKNNKEWFIYDNSDYFSNKLDEITDFVNNISQINIDCLVKSMRTCNIKDDGNEEQALLPAI